MKRSSLPKRVLICRWHSKPSRWLECHAVIAEQHTKLGLADAHRIRQHGLEYRSQLARRTTDHGERLRGRRLLLQRFGELAGSAVELLLKIRRRGTATARSRCLLAPLELRRLAVSLHLRPACLAV